MRFRPASRALIAGLSLLAASPMVPDRPARADILIGSTLIPTSSVVTTSAYVPTSYVMPTSSLLPTSYVVPTSSYFSTGSILETDSSYYLPTSYVSTYRRGLFRPRRFVERTSYYASPTSYLSPSFASPTSYLSASSLVPTSYVATSGFFPTSYVVPTMATSTYLPTTYLAPSYFTPTSYVVGDGLVATTALGNSPVCYDVGTPTVAAAVEPTPTRAVAPRNGSSPVGNTIISQPEGSRLSPAEAERAPQVQLRPTPNDDGATATIEPPVATPKVPAAPRAKPAEPVSPPAPESSNDIPMPDPGAIGKPQTDEAVSRQSFKPSSYGTRPTFRNVLRGRVVSFDTGQPEEAVTVVLTSRTGKYDDRPTQTNADGEFKVSLPEGDWTVKVTMPTGSVFRVGKALTASGGQIVDPAGKNVGEMIIKR